MCLLRFFKKETSNPEKEVSIEIRRRNLKKEIENEVAYYSSLIVSSEFRGKQQNDQTKISTKHFWQKKMLECPHLSKLARVLLNIPSSNAPLERFFSICGIINKQRSMNMSDELLIMRALLKANVTYLNELNDALNKE